MRLFLTCFSLPLPDLVRSQAAGEDQLSARGHREAAEAPGQAQAALHGPDSTPEPGAQQTQEQGQRGRERSVRRPSRFYCVCVCLCLCLCLCLCVFVCVCVINAKKHCVLYPHRLSQAEYHEQEEIFKLRLGHLKKVGVFCLFIVQTSR